MGIRIKKYPASQDSEAEKHCIYLDNGFCLSCDCNACEGGYLINEWREELRCGNSVSGPKECDCVQKARNQKYLRDSGLNVLVERCTFDSFLTETSWQAAVKEKALKYSEEFKKKCFFISGQSGSGKTHICTAICNIIMNNGNRLKYFQYVRDGTKLKQLITEQNLYEKEISELITVPYLYIDDLFKGEISPADLRLVYEIINGRYLAGKPFIISSERSLAFIRDLRGGDGEAIAGRIYECCSQGKYCLELSGAEKNQRFSNKLLNK